MKKYIFPMAIAAVLLAYQNCSDVSFKTTTAGKMEGPTDDDIETVNRLCNNAGANLKSTTLSFTFKNPRDIPGVGTPVCKWNENGNVSKQNEYVTARHEQLLPLQLPANSDICGATFSFNRQEQKYDDQFFFILNKKILASNALFTINNSRTKKTDYTVNGKNLSVPHYDWLDIVSTNWPKDFNTAAVSNANNFCLGKAEGLGNCSWPITETDGDIIMDFDPSIMRIVGLEGQDALHEVGFVITGDDDGGTDCQHKSVSFSITVQYITR